MPVRPAGSGQLPVHRLSAAGFHALARGDGGKAVVEELLAAERSRRMLLLRALHDGLSGGGASPAAGGDAISYREAWALLERAQGRAPDVFEDILMSPHTGMWLSLALRLPGVCPPRTRRSGRWWGICRRWPPPRGRGPDSTTRSPCRSAVASRSCRPWGARNLRARSRGARLKSSRGTGRCGSPGRRVLWWSSRRVPLGAGRGGTQCADLSSG